MSSALHSTSIAAAGVIVLALSAGQAAAGSLSPFEEHSIQGGDSSHGSGATAPTRHTFSSGTASGGSDRRAILGFALPFGIVLDYSSGVPRMRGLALMQGDNVRLEASGQIAPGFDNVTGQLSISFNF